MSTNPQPRRSSDGRLRELARAIATILCLVGTVLSVAGGAAAPAQRAAIAPVPLHQVELATCLMAHGIHSHEEDTAETQVYRPAGFPFPPTRGRTGFALRVDGEATMHGIAPADGPLATPGQWLFLPPDSFQIAALDGSSEAFLFTAVSCESDRLVVR